ncbi:pyruvate dehydrogenase E1 component alpha subunit [Nonlabens ulvanivorans]|uniref:Pyruvate dehydrogenase E1 component alpha subunit n=2 Tax=Nonlabens TaxID=363408 RepID=A0A090Q893_NONUL|nr:thiamine pyrophosphate-dependent enzyme [Nonlabens ulvanivorans]GAK99230.1 pyruvate dehydrogenase E1 component alpha subunit [Nonlabens ulvanivorans]
MKKVTKDVLLNWYEEMLFWRKFEDKLAQVYIQQKVRGFLHLYNGQEAILAGSLHAMDLTKDKMITAYRNHVQPIGMGVDPKRVMAELYGKATGYLTRIRWINAYFFKRASFLWWSRYCRGGQIPLGAGIAFGDKYHNVDAVTLTFFGDGAARQGSLHEAFNLAMLWNLPVVFCVENNGYAMGTSVERTANHTDIWKLGLGYEMPCGPVDAMDPEKVAEAMSEAIERARSGGGPTFLELKTYRYRGHSMSDAQHYRTKDEVAEYQKIDPITQIKDRLMKDHGVTEEKIKEMGGKRVKSRVAECEKFAEDSPYPDKSVMYDAVYEQEDYPFLPSKL